MNTMKLRPYKRNDAKTILGWIKDGLTFRRWSSDRYEKYPITEDDINYKYFDCNGYSAALLCSAQIYAVQCIYFRGFGRVVFGDCIIFTIEI